MNTTKAVPNFNDVQDGVTWIGGTSHQLQRQHIPGYQGHVHGLFSENVYGKSFARVTAECINERHEKGIDHSIDDRYATSYKSDFNEPDNRKKQFINTAESLLSQVEQKEKVINEEIQKQYMKQPKSLNEVPPIDRVPVVGYKGHRPVFRQPLKKVDAPTEPKQIKLKEREILENMLGTGTLDEKQYQKQAKQEPVVGYTGFLKGVKSENQYGQVYKDLAANSIRR